MNWPILADIIVVYSIPMLFLATPVGIHAPWQRLLGHFRAGGYWKRVLRLADRVLVACFVRFEDLGAGFRRLNGWFWIEIDGYGLNFHF